MSESYYLTKQGFRRLQERIKTLEAELSRLQSQVADAAEIGGNQWHDNASYEQLVIDIRGVDHQLSEAHRILNRAMIVDASGETDKVLVGTIVKLLLDGTEETWRIAGYGESDPDQNILAYNTPLAHLIMGKRAGEIIRGVIAGRTVEIKIIAISREKET